MKRLQFDYLSNPARQLVPYLKTVKSKDAEVEKLREMLLSWDFVMDKNSIPAAIYEALERKILERAYPQLVPEKGREVIKTVSIKSTIRWIKTLYPKERDSFVLACLQEAIQDLHKKLGDDLYQWQYGQPAYHHVLIKHPLSNAVNDSLRTVLECGPLPRGGSGSTPGVTSNTDNQTHGATFRIVADVTNWDNTWFTNAPGQSGNPESSFYKNLFERWATDQHFPVYFSREKINKSVKEKTIVKP